MKRHGRIAVQVATFFALAQLGIACGGDDSNGGGAGTPGSGGATGGSGGQATGGSAQGGSSGTGGGATGGAGGASGTGGSTDAGRESGAGTGGGASDSGPVSEAGGDSGGAPAACNPVPVDMSTCTMTGSCTVACGVDISALSTTKPHRTCTCGGGGGGDGGGDGGGGGVGRRWSCPSGPGSCVYPMDVDLTCLVVPSNLSACPRDPTVDGGADAGGGLIRTGFTACQVPNSETCGSICGSAMANTFSYQTSAGTPSVGYCVCIGGIYQCAPVNEWYTP